MGVFQRGNQWWIEFRYKNKRYREAVGPDKDLARDVLGKRRNEIRENRFYPDKLKDPDPVRFHDFASEYLQWAKANKRASTCLRDLYTMRRFDEEFEKKNIQGITTWQIDKYIAKRRKDLKPASVNRELALLKHIFSKALEWKKINQNPAKDVKRLKGETKRLRSLMPDEIQVLLSNCDGLLRGLLKSLVNLDLHTGARKGELQNLKWPQVNFEIGMISFLDTKNGERREVPMNETARSTLEGLERTSEFVFPNRNGKRIDDAQVQIAFTEAVKRSGLEDFHFHDLRHTFASNLVMAGVDLLAVKELLGHKKIEMTLRYAHLAPDHKTRAVNVLDRVMCPQKRPQEKKVINFKT